MSNAGPLTTTFTAPASCAAATGIYQVWPASDTYYYEQGPLLSRTDCYPGGYGASPSQYYSPGLCPNGYTPACSSTDVVSTTVTETAYTCCPTAADYTCAGTADTPASASSSSSSPRPYLGCTTVIDQAVVLAGVTVLSGGTTDLVPSTTETAGAGLGANSIAVRFRSGDFSSIAGPGGDNAGATEGLSALATSGILSTATLAIPVPTSTTATATNTTGAATSTSAATSKGEHAGVSTTQAVGIGVGSAALALIAAGAAGLFLWLRRRKQRIRAQIETPIPPPAPPPKDKRFRPPAPLKLERGGGSSLDVGVGHGGGGGGGGGGVASVARSVNGRMIRGPFELQSRGKGGAGRRGGHSPIWSAKSTDRLRSNAATPPFWSPPPSYGSQPAELESPQRSVMSAGWGNLRGRAELASP